MILESIENLSFGSHKTVTVTCDFGKSTGCYKAYKRVYKDVVFTRARNEDKDICLSCSRAIKSTGRLNPNCKYPNFDDTWMDKIDFPEKAYLLGWIASDGSLSKKNNTISISIHEKDEELLQKISSFVPGSLPIRRHKNRNMVSLCFCSKGWHQAVCSHLSIPGGNKSHTVQSPKLSSRKLNLAFLRGQFDGDGSVSDKAKNGYLKVSLASCSPQVLESAKALVNNGGSISRNSLHYSNRKAMYFLDFIYEQAPQSLRLKRKYDLYLRWKVKYELLDERLFVSLY